MKILDCTFRDGGYYNQWDFDIDLAYRYMTAMHDAGVDAIEIGFRFTPKNDFIGPFGYSLDSFLELLPRMFQNRIPLAVMVNGSDITAGVEASSIFASCCDSPVDIVRIAVHYGKIEQCEMFAKDLFDLGYKVCVNLMQTGGKSENEIIQAVDTVKKWGCVEVLYFADSLGDMSSVDVKRCYQIIRGQWEKEIGFHSHDNKGLAISNTLHAIELGVDWVDCTVLGMGRGAGNARTEYLLSELSTKYASNKQYSPDKVFDLAMSDFSELHQQYKWGPNLLYYLSAVHHIHPTYVQQMIMMKYSVKQMLDGIKKLSRSPSSSYNKDCLIQAIESDNVIEADGSWMATDWLQFRDVLLIASGKSVLKYKTALINYVVKKKPFVMCLNINTEFPSEYVDAYEICDTTRLLTEIDRYSPEIKVLAPTSLIENKDTYKHLKFLDYGVSVKSGEWSAGTKKCVIPSLLAAPYALAALTAGGACNVFLAGFDGYESGDVRQNAMSDFFALYSGPPLLSVTPTTYNIAKSSIYAPQFSGG